MSEDYTGQSILVVDDVPDNIDVVAGVLGSEFTIKAATSGEKALKIACAEPYPDLILLDIQMPGMDGYEVCRTLQSDLSTRNIPIIFVTALGAEEDEKKGLELGAVDYISKPISPAIVRARVQTHLSLKKHRDHLELLAQQRAQQLIHAERLATIGTLTAGILHEINNPLGYLLGFAGYLQEDFAKISSLFSQDFVPSEEAVKECVACLATGEQSVNAIVEGAQRIKVIAESMRKFAARGEETKSPVHLDDCIDNALALCHNTLKYRVAVEKHTESSLPTVFANGQQLEQVLVNIFRNAADAMEPQQEGSLAIFLGHKDANLCLTVEDSGPGIPQDRLENIWDAFYTTKDLEHGTGLGLSISKGIIEDHQGRIWCENAESGGTRFVIELPVLTAL